MNENKLHIALAGANGRLGQQIAKIINDDHKAEVALNIVRNTRLDERKRSFDLLIDVSSTDGVVDHLAAMVSLQRPMVIGVTGFTPEQTMQIEQAATQIPILLSGNFSVGITSLLQQARTTANALGSTWAVEIEETHHLDKKDHPSGTALMLAQAVLDGFGCKMVIHTSLWPKRPDCNPEGQISIVSRREPDVIGTHTLRFSNGREEVLLGHTANSRSIFADGALVAAKWIAGQTPGLYTMEDVLET